MPPRLESEVSESVMRALGERQRQSGSSLDSIVDALLSESLELERHSLFQVSTSNALVQGVFGGSITVGDLKRHGDFGLGTFAGLDGEMIMVDGECFRATANGSVSLADDDREVPFALVARFRVDVGETIDSALSMAELTERLEELRPSENLFVGIRVDGRFDEVSMRVVCPARRGEGLVEATSHQSEFEARDVDGSLVGFWAPEYSMAVSVPGYHFHFISDDREVGGHVLGLSGHGFRVGLHTESDLHLSLPETEEFLSADLRGRHASELHTAETEHRAD